MSDSIVTVFVPADGVELAALAGRADADYSMRTPHLGCMAGVSIVGAP